MPTTDPEAFVHLESATRGEFIELHEADNRLRVRCGLIGRPCLVLNTTFKTPGKARANHERLHAAWQSKGFEECQPSSPVIEGSVADELFCDLRVAHPLLDTFFRINGASELRGQPRRLALFRHGLRWEGDFDLERIAELGLHAGVIVEGDVEVRGVFSQLTSTYPEQVLIAGSVQATSFGHGDSHMHVLGDVRVDNIVYGEYNDGSLRIGGSVHGRAFIRSGHDMHAEGGYHLPVCDWDMDDNWSTCLHPDLFDPDEDEDSVSRMLSAESIRAFMREGRDPFRPGAQPAMPEPEPPAPGPPPPSDFAKAVWALVQAEDVEGITCLLETWPTRDEEWRAAVAGRLCAPTTTAQQRERLLRLKKAGWASSSENGQR